MNRYRISFTCNGLDVDSGWIDAENFEQAKQRLRELIEPGILDGATGWVEDEHGKRWHEGDPPEFYGE